MPPFFISDRGYVISDTNLGDHGDFSRAGQKVCIVDLTINYYSTVPGTGGGDPQALDRTQNTGKCTKSRGI